MEIIPNSILKALNISKLKAIDTTTVVLFSDLVRAEDRNKLGTVN